MQQPQELRKSADWYRGFAKVGHDEDRAWRNSFAEYLEKLADEIEHIGRRDQHRKVIT